MAWIAAAVFLLQLPLLLLCSCYRIVPAAVSGITGTRCVTVCLLQLLPGPLLLLWLQLPPLLALLLQLGVYDAIAAATGMPRAAGVDV